MRQFTFSSLAYAVIACALQVTTASAGVRHVKWDAAGANNGTGWADAYPDLQLALTAATTGDEIWVAAGTYRPTLRTTPADPRSATFRLKNGVSIYGGFDGTETIRSERNPLARETDLSGDLNGDDGPGFENNSENSYHVVTGSGSDSTAVLDGFRIIGGNANGTSSPHNGGGGLCAVIGSPTITSCRFASNWCTRYGGGVYTYQSNSVFTACEFIGNNSDYYGGGVFNNMSSPTLVNCILRGNHAPYGGGMYNNNNSNPTLLNCVCSLNSAHEGGIGNSASSPVMVNCLISGNAVVNLGGAMSNLDGSNPQLLNCTIVANTAVNGFGVYNKRNSHPTLTNCILWSNRKTDGSSFLPQIVNDTADCSTDVAYSCVQGGAAGAGNLSDDPLFVDPNGPDAIPQTADDDYRIGGGSPCVDAGDSTAVPPSVTTALDGGQRLLDDPTATDHGLGGKPPVDIGAYELWDFQVPRTVRVVCGAAQAGGDGKTWATAWNNLAFALSESAKPTPPGEPPIAEIWVAAGTYTPGPPGPRTATFKLRNQLKLIGGFHPAWSPFVSAPFLHETTLSGDLNGDDRGLADSTLADNAFHVVSGSGTNGTALLYGFTIEGGNANGTMYPNDCGGGMFNHQGSPTVISCLFRSNIAIDGGGMFNLLGSPQVTNCRFIGNRAADSGGGMYNETASLPLVAHCTFIGNSAAGSGGGLTAFDAYDIYADPNQPTLLNSIFRGNQARVGPELSIQEGRFSFSVLSVAGCNIQNAAQSAAVGANCDLVWDAGLLNRDLQPLLKPDAHLWAISPLIDANNNSLLPADAADLDRDGDLTEAIPIECDGEERIVNSRADIGADEYADVDRDGLPDAWERKFFGSATAADPGADPDDDGLSNLDECQLYGSDPVAPPYFVDVVAGSDSYDGLAQTVSSDGIGPKKTIQAAITAAGSRTTVVVGAGSYLGTGNVNLDFAGKPIVLLAQAGPANTVLDCSGSGRAVNFATLPSAGAAIQGFTLTGGGADRGGALRLDGAGLLVKSCALSGNSATVEAAGVWSELGNLLVSDLLLEAADGTGSAGVLAFSGVDLAGDLTVSSGRLDLRSSRVDGVGRLLLGPAGTLQISRDHGRSPEAAASPTIIRSTIIGSGRLAVDAGEELVLGGNACVDLREPGSGEPCGQGGIPAGEILIDGKLLVRDNSSVRNANVNVRQASIKEGSEIQYNDIFMLDAMQAGGEFFVAGGATIANNIITSVGDRYLDLDPDPSVAQHPSINQNIIHVRVETDPALPRGTMLELRAQDADCGIAANLDCRSGAFPVVIGDRFEALPAQNWLLETLEVRPGAKVNLTNRPGFQFHPGGAHPDTVYVKTLKLHPGAVLNTALQALYYESLVDETGAPLTRDPATPDAPLANGSRIVDQPLLGFSLGIIAMNDQTASPFNEFNIRVRKRLTDPEDENPPTGDPFYVGLVSRLADAHDPVTHDGAMEMGTKAVGKQSASSVAAKGSFARAGEETLIVAFEYLFMNGGDAGDAEIIVKLSDEQDVGIHNYEVGRVRPPMADQPGSIGSGQYATYYIEVPYDAWSTALGTTVDGQFKPGKFVRGSYVELELRGTGAVVRIDNWDPQVTCRDTDCASFDGVLGQTEPDYLILLAEYGRSISESGHSCLDLSLSGDRRVDLSDLLSWDAYLAGDLGACGAGGPSLAPQSSSTERAPAAEGGFPPGSLIISGKGRTIGQQDRIYSFSSTGAQVGAQNPWSTPKAAPIGHRANGRLFKDSQSRVYQLHGQQGLVRSDGVVVIPPKGRDAGLLWHDQPITVGVTGSGEYFNGVPLQDVAFHPSDPDVIFVTPVVLWAPGHAYRATAQLRLIPGTPYDYALEAVYGTDPWMDSVAGRTDPPEASYTVTRLRELELNSTGTTLYVTSSRADGNEWLLVYDLASRQEYRVALTSCSAALNSPTAMLASSRAEVLYLASTDAAHSGLLYRLDLAALAANSYLPAPGMVSTLALPVAPMGFVRQVTAISEDPDSGKLHVLGFEMPYFDEQKKFTIADAIFTTPWLLTVSPGNPWPASTMNAITLGGTDLGLPISLAVLPGNRPADFNADGQVDGVDLDIFAACSSGPGLFYNPTAMPTGCSPMPVAADIIAADLDADHDVDAADFGQFQRAWMTR